MKKRLLSVILTGAMAVGCLAGTGACAFAAEGEDSYNISFIVKHTDGHFNKVMAGAQAYADEHDNVTVEFQSPTSQTDYDGQVNMIETALSNNSIDGLVIAPLQSDSAASLVNGTDKPVVACDTDFTSDYKAAFVGTGNEDAAYSGGEAAIKQLQEQGVESPTVAILTGVQGDETHEARLKGFKDAVEDYGAELLEVQYDALADKASTAMEAVIQKYPEGVDIVMTIADEIAMAAAKVRKDSGGEAYADTVIVGFDGNQSALESLQEGTIAIDVAQEGYNMGYKAVEAVVAVLNGENVDEYIDSGSTVVDAANVEDYIQSMKDIGVWDE